MATRTAPTVDPLNITAVLVTLHVIDSSGDNFTQAFKLLGNPNPADIETLVASYQLVTQASVWKVSVLEEYEGDEDPDNADVGQRNSVKDGINLLWKDVANQKTTSPRLVAPVPTAMQGNQDIPLLSDVNFTALISAMGTLLTGYNLVSAQYTERRERSNNPRIKA